MRVDLRLFNLTIFYLAVLKITLNMQIYQGAESYSLSYFVSARLPLLFVPWILSVRANAMYNSAGIR